MKYKFKFLDSNMLKLLAVCFMLSDHLWATIVAGNQWMNYVGRLAFPIFAFLIAEGFIHTKNYRKYLERLLIFAVISEVPFDLFYGGTYFYPFHQNVLFTLLFGLISINAISKGKAERTIKSSLVTILIVALAVLAGTLLFTDYGGKGVLTVIIFYIFRDFRGAWILQLISMALLHGVLYQGLYIPVEIFGHIIDFHTQGFAVLSLIPIWLYNGKSGFRHPVLKYGFYIFYPLHMLMLYFLFESTIFFGFCLVA